MCTSPSSTWASAATGSSQPPPSCGEERPLPVDGSVDIVVVDRVQTLERGVVVVAALDGERTLGNLRQHRRGSSSARAMRAP